MRLKTRLSRYENSDSLSRVDRNKTLYDDMYENTNYSNMVETRQERNNFNKEEYDNIKEETKTDEKLYDINQVLRRAKENRNIIEDANEKRKFQNYKFNDNIEEELNKTRKVYENLIKEEKELLNLMNTMTDVSSNTIANEMFQDLTKDDNFTEVLEDITENVGIKQIDKDTTEYSTDTFMFNTKDFEDLDDLRDDVKRSSVFIKVLIVLMVLAVLGTLYYMFFIKK